MSFSLTRKTDYALVALSALTRQQDAEGPPLSTRQIAEVNGLPLQLLMNVMKELHRAKMVGSRRGVSGGYYLDRPPEEISLRDVIEVMEGPVSVALCSSDHEVHDGPNCQMVDTCLISSPIQKFNGLLNDFLGGISLRHLVEGETPVTIPMGVVV